MKYWKSFKLQHLALRKAYLQVVSPTIYEGELEDSFKALQGIFKIQL